MLGLGPGMRTKSLERLSPEEVLNETFTTVKALVSCLAGHGPTVIVLEDLHWADPTSLSLTEQLTVISNEAPLLFILTHRPDPDPGVTIFERALGQTRSVDMRQIDLGPLSEEAEYDLVRGLLGQGRSDGIVNTVREGAEGNPLFLEQRLASLIETNALVRTDGGGWQIHSAAPGHVPEILERLVRSRVDRLPPDARDAVVAASVIGPEFSLSTLAVVTDLDTGLGAALLELCESGLLMEQRQIPELAYRFRHALIQDAIYVGLLRRQRQNLHSRAAWALEQSTSGRVEERSGLLAYHFAKAGDNQRAVHYLEMSGDRSAAAFANDEALISYHQAIELLGEDAPDRVAAAALWAKLARVHWRLGQFAESRRACDESTRIALANGEHLWAAKSLLLLGAVETAGHCHSRGRRLSPPLKRSSRRVPIKSPTSGHRHGSTSRRNGPTSITGSTNRKCKWRVSRPCGQWCRNGPRRGKEPTSIVLLPSSAAEPAVT